MKMASKLRLRTVFVPPNDSGRLQVTPRKRARSRAHGIAVGGGVIVASVLLLTALAPLARATSYSWSCNQSSCVWQGTFTGSDTPNNGCTPTDGGTHWNVNTPTLTSGKVQLFADTTCNSPNMKTQSKDVWGGMNSPSETAWKSSTSTYSISVTFLVVGIFSIALNCQLGGSTVTATVALYTDINTYDDTTGTNPQSAVAMQQERFDAGCPGGGGNPQEQNLAVDQSFSQTSPSFFKFTQNDLVSISADVRVYVNVYIDGSAQADLQNAQTVGVTDAAYLTAISWS